MSGHRTSWPALAGAIGLMLLAAGCVAADGGYGYAAVAPGYDYYEPYGGVYGDWGPGYEVGPWRGGRDRGGAVGRGAVRSGGASHAFRAAPAGRATPSIPSGARSGGGRGGGGRR